ncbi:MAG: hypothetical protein K9M98_05340 [Cephaloticoccus sp.]|nr:hypothetical protein [Cephaloticoccus sp.]
MAVVATCCMIAQSLLANTDDPDPWQAAGRLDYTTASNRLAQLIKQHPEDNRVACAYAASLLVREPVTQVQVEQSRHILASVLARTHAQESTYRPLAIYLLARIAHDHADPPDFGVAQSCYEQLRREYPQHPLADEAAVHLGVMRAFSPSTVHSPAAVAILEQLLQSVSTASARRELHHLLAYLHWHLRHDVAAALPHYIACREIGFETPYRDSEIDLTIAGLAEELGQDDVAARHYLAFAGTNPTDARTQTARQLAHEAQLRVGVGK